MLRRSQPGKRASKPGGLMAGSDSGGLYQKTTIGLGAAFAASLVALLLLWIGNMNMADKIADLENELKTSENSATTLTTKLKVSEKKLERERLHYNQVATEHDTQIEMFEKEIADLHEENHDLSLKLQETKDSLDDLLEAEGARGDAHQAVVESCDQNLKAARRDYAAAEQKAARWKDMYDAEVLAHAGTNQRYAAASTEQVEVDPVPPAPPVRRAPPANPVPPPVPQVPDVPPPVADVPPKRGVPPPIPAARDSKRKAAPVPDVPPPTAEPPAAAEREAGASSTSNSRARRRPAVPAPTPKEYVVEEESF